MYSINVAFLCCKQIGNDIWFPSDVWNALYKYDIVEKKIQWIGEFPGEILWNDTLFSDMYVYGTKIFFIPCHAAKVHTYDIETGVFESLEMPVDSQDLCYFMQGIIFDGNLYLIGFEYKGILKLNLDTYEFEIINEWVEQLDRQFGIRKDQGLIGRESVLVGHKLFMPCLQNNVIVEMDMRDNQYQFHIVGNKEDKYASVHKLEDVLLLITCDRKLIFWGENQITEIEVNWEITPQYKLVCQRNEELWIFSTIAFEYLKVNLRSKEVTSYKIPDVGSDCIIWAKTIGQKIYFSTYVTGDWYLIDEQDKIEKLPEKLKEPRENFIDEFIKEQYTKQIIKENLRFPLGCLLRKTVISEEEYNISEQYNNVGKRIYDYIASIE